MNDKVIRLCRGVVAVTMATGLAGFVPAGTGEAASAAAKRYQNCTALNKVFAHGVARTGAKDKVRGRTKPVTKFKVDARTYAHNTHLDRDKDGVACEKR